MATAPHASAGAAEPLPRFGWVLIAMLAELVAAPFFGGLPGFLLTARVVTVAVLLSALWIGGARRAAIFLYGPVLATQLAASYASSAAIEGISAALHLAFMVFVFGFVVKRVAFARRVSLDTIAGAACAYLLIALIWGDLYLLLQLVHPGSIVVTSDWSSGSSRDLRVALVYFSFVTLTTVGHVFDVAGPAPGSLCVAETLVGQLYLAVLIARLVGMHASQGMESQAKPSEPPS